jgi:hypothetical protein
MLDDVYGETVRGFAPSRGPDHMGMFGLLAFAASPARAFTGVMAFLVASRAAREIGNPHGAWRRTWPRSRPSRPAIDGGGMSRGGVDAGDAHRAMAGRAGPSARNCSASPQSIP